LLVLDEEKLFLQTFEQNLLIIFIKTNLMQFATYVERSVYGTVTQLLAVWQIFHDYPLPAVGDEKTHRVSTDHFTSAYPLCHKLSFRVTCITSQKNNTSQEPWTVSICQ